ncbi:MAG: dihydrofolate reductase family protein [Bacteroidales bacterium]|nr:dihydrofolate reductase family protein [Bacteroidales bacterium]
MKKIKLYIAASIDGYIAREDGDLDWLMKYPVDSETNYGYDDFFASIDTIIMGGRTYRDILGMGPVWPYKDKTTFVITRNPVKAEEDIHFIHERIMDKIGQLREKEGKDIWLVGGGEIIAMLQDHGMIDEITITYIPVTLGKGIRLFPASSGAWEWNLDNKTSYNNGVTQVIYRLKK